MKKIIAGAIAAALLIVAAFLWLFLRFDSNQKTAPLTEAQLEFSPSVELFLEERQVLVKDFLEQDLVLDAINVSNIANENLSEEEILDLDQQWRAGSDDYPLIQETLNNEISNNLLDFQRQHPEFSEIFVTDQFGLNVAQTNRTTDYYQADEDWWTGAYANGAGESSHGPIEFDESSQSQSIALYIPIQDPKTKKVVGVSKAVLDILNLKLSL